MKSSIIWTDKKGNEHEFYPLRLLMTVSVILFLFVVLYFYGCDPKQEDADELFVTNYKPIDSYDDGNNYNSNSDGIFDHRPSDFEIC